jgi:OFA family oxalate/formate antiporter-like MFS transporter
MQTGQPVTRCRASHRAKPIVEISFCCQQLSVPDTNFHKSKLVLVSASLLAATLGSVHAFSVFLIPLESSFETTRSMVSLTYSLALVALTVAVLLGHHVFSRFSPSVFVLSVCVIAAVGALIAAFAPSLASVWFGYSLLFGGANGLGYGFGLQIAAQANPGREGTAMGIVTAAYAFGAAVSPGLFTYALTLGGFRTAMLGLFGVLCLVALICSVLFKVSQVVFRPAQDPASRSSGASRDIFLLWVGYGTGVAGGLMAIGHAAGIATALKYDGAVWMAPAVIAVSNLAGSLVAGRLMDRSSEVSLLAGLPLLSASAVAALAVFGGPNLVMISMAVVGFAYSPSLGYSIGLGFIKRGDERKGEIVRAVDPVRGGEVDVEIVSAHFIDPEGERVRG